MLWQSHFGLLFFILFWTLLGEGLRVAKAERLLPQLQLQVQDEHELVKDRLNSLLYLSAGMTLAETVVSSRLKHKNSANMEERIMDASQQEFFKFSIAWADFWMKMAETVCWNLKNVYQIFGLENGR